MNNAPNTQPLPTASSLPVRHDGNDAQVRPSLSIEALVRAPRQRTGSFTMRLERVALLQARKAASGS